MNTPGIPRRTFVVDAVDDVLDRLRARGAERVGAQAQYGDIYRYCYVRGPDGIIIGLVEEHCCTTHRARSAVRTWSACVECSGQTSRSSSDSTLPPGLSLKP
jgi:hypothetical protein